MIIKAKNFKDWMKANFTKQELQDMINYGVDTGYNKLTYYKDTVKLYEKFKEEIWDSLISDAIEYGYNNVYEFIASFKYANGVNSYEEHANLLVWYMAEKAARELIENGA